MGSAPHDSPYEGVDDSRRGRLEIVHDVPQGLGLEGFLYDGTHASATQLKRLLEGRRARDDHNRRGRSHVRSSPCDLQSAPWVEVDIGDDEVDAFCQKIESLRFGRGGRDLATPTLNYVGEQLKDHGVVVDHQYLLVDVVRPAHGTIIARAMRRPPCNSCCRARAPSKNATH